jgi:hypothetical protein
MEPSDKGNHILARPLFGIRAIKGEGLSVPKPGIPSLKVVYTWTRDRFF